MAVSIRSSFWFAVSLATAIFAFGTACAQAAAGPMARTVPMAVALHRAAYVGALRATTPMHLVVSLPLRNSAALKALLRSQIYNPASPMYHHYLSVSQFGDAFSPSASDIARSARFFAGRGLTVGPITPNHMLLDVTGPLSAVERVFHVHVGLYRHPTENRLFFSADREPKLDLSIPVAQVIGLDNYALPTRRVVRSTNSAMPRVGSGPGGYFTGNDMRTAYYPAGSLTGSGQSIGLMEIGGYNLSDVQLFFQKHYGRTNSVPVIGIKTDGNRLDCPVAAGCDDAEQALDIEYAISVAPGLESVRVYVGNSPEDVLNRQASENASKVLSTSWGWDRTYATTDENFFLEFAAQGQTNLTASGDYSSLVDSLPWPEESANITAVGGSNVVTNRPGGTWSSETGWIHSAGGPAVDLIPTESYQAPYVNSPNQASPNLRNVPDVAANADNFEICANGECVGGYGGTSFASPIWAGIIALANQEAAQFGRPPVGFINPTIYAIGRSSAYALAFHDIVDGTNGIFPCTPSYDLVTGLGSPNGQLFIGTLVLTQRFSRN
ncbi:MAG: S53 family serine peptidase [Candidatus Eremiobacteraeota bacterium]|nr:S53 family serine peptidase [Candidatus Eremiobacteraeota bacterium]